MTALHTLLLLTVLGFDQPEVLADLIMNADEKQFVVIYPKFKLQAEHGLPVLTAEIDKKLPKDLLSSDERREKLAKRQVNAAVALLKMNQPEKVWPLLKHSPDPRVRSYLIHRLSPLGVDVKAIVKRLDDEPDITIRRALLLALGEFDEKDIPIDVRTTLLPKLQAIYRIDADPGLHAASEWLLNIWKQDAWLKHANEDWAEDTEGREKKIAGIKELVTKDKENALPQWYVNTQRQTFVVIPGPVEFTMGSPATEAGRQDAETQHKRRIGRTFAIAAKSVTVEQYCKFNKLYELPAVRTRSEELPVAGMSWYQAAAYLNWLSKDERIPQEQWCFLPNKDGKYEDGMSLSPNYLSLSGYRLPTEAEMEYATRAGALTSRYFGETDELLVRYAWYRKNSQEQTWPVGSLKPNDLGLFDMQGNVFTWCQDGYKPYPQREETNDDEEDLVIKDSARRVLRGGSFFHQASAVRSATRNLIVPTYQINLSGFRVARTVVDLTAEEKD